MAEGRRIADIAEINPLLNSTIYTLNQELSSSARMQLGKILANVRMSYTFGFVSGESDYVASSTVDNKTLIQLAIDEMSARGGGLLYFKGHPTATYILNGMAASTPGPQIIPKPGVFIIGDGLSTVFDSRLARDSSNTYKTSIFGHANSATGLDANGKWYIFANFKMQGAFHHGTGSTYQGSGGGQTGIRLYNCEYSFKHQLYFEGYSNCTNDGGNSDHTFVNSGQNAKKAYITCCNCKDIVGGFQGTGQTELNISNNTFEDVADDCVAMLSDGSEDNYCQLANISNCTMRNGLPLNDNGVPGVGIFLKADQSGGGIEKSRGINISNINSYNVFQGMQVNSIRGLNVSRFNVFTSKRSGIKFTSRVQGGKVSDCYFYDCNTEGNTSEAGVSIDGNCMDITYFNNTFEGTNRTHNQGVLVQASGGVCSHVDVLSNKFINNSGTAGEAHIHLKRVSDSEIYGNHFISGTIGYAIRGDGTGGVSKNVNIDGNHFDGPTYISGKITFGSAANYTDVTIGTNPGFKNYCRGSADFVTTDTQITITHGLDVQPEEGEVMVFPTGNQSTSTFNLATITNDTDVKINRVANGDVTTRSVGYAIHVKYLNNPATSPVIS